MTRFAERAPLDFTKPRSKQKILVCPHCKGSSTVSVDCVGKICQCGKYFSAGSSLSKKEATHSNNTNIPVNKVFTALKADMETKAYKWRDEQIEKRKAGKTRDHEQINPDGTMPKKKWGRDDDY